MSFSFQQLKTVSQISLDDDITTGNRLFGYVYLFGERVSFFKNALIEHVRWVDARIASDVKQSGPSFLFTMAGRQITEPTWQGSETEKWRKELIVLGDQSSESLKQDREEGGGGQGKGVLMSLKMFLNITRKPTAAKGVRRHFMSVTEGGKVFQIRVHRVLCGSLEQDTEQAQARKQHQYQAILCCDDWYGAANVRLWWIDYWTFGSMMDWSKSLEPLVFS